MYTYICEKCGAYLDPGEDCDCEKKDKFISKNKKQENKYNRTTKDRRMMRRNA